MVKYTTAWCCGIAFLLAWNLEMGWRRLPAGLPDYGGVACWGFQIMGVLPAGASRLWGCCPKTNSKVFRASTRYTVAEHVLPEKSKSAVQGNRIPVRSSCKQRFIHDYTTCVVEIRRKAMTWMKINCFSGNHLKIWREKLMTQDAEIWLQGNRPWKRGQQMMTDNPGFPHFGQTSQEIRRRSARICRVWFSVTVQNRQEFLFSWICPLTKEFKLCTI